MAETPTREELLEAHNAYLSAWLEAAQAEHAEMAALLADAERGHAEAMKEADGLRVKVWMLQQPRGCCKVDGGEDGK